MLRGDVTDKYIWPAGYLQHYLGMCLYSLENSVKPLDKSVVAEALVGVEPLVKVLG